MKQEEGDFRGAGGLKLFYQTWTPETVKGHLVITHGQGEHSDCYQRLAEGLSNANVKIWGWDLRGHGQSQGVRGSVKDFGQYGQDYEIFLKRVVFPATQKNPVILLGHSMGALIQLLAFLEDEDLHNFPQILSSPYLGVGLQVPAWKSALSVAAYQVLPEMGVDNGIVPEMLTSDPAVLKEFRRDPLRHTKISAGAFEGSKEAMDAVLEHAAEFKSKILILGSDDDPVVSTAKIKAFAENLPPENSELHLLPGARHEPFNDVGRENVFRTLDQFIKGCL